MRRPPGPRGIGPRGLHADDGVSLLLALALVVGVGVIVGSLLTYAGVSLSTVGAQRDSMQASYDVDAALQQAVDTVRTSHYNQDADSTDHCLGPASDVLRTPTGVSGTEVAVRCTPKPGTGADSSKVAITDQNRFADAIFTTDTSSATGAALHQNVLASVLMRGGVVSKGGITVDGGPSCTQDAAYPGGGTTCGGLWSEGDVRAAGTCSGTLMSVGGTKACLAASTPAQPTESSPAPTASTQYRVVPNCPTSSTAARVELQPGYYDDAPALNALTGAGCAVIKELVFRPGNYYFDFHWPTPADNEWLINNSHLTVIGGDPSSETVFEKGLCTSPLKQTGDHGVRFVFGGTSKLRVSAGEVSLCGTYSLTAPPVAVFGATSGAILPVTRDSKPGGGISGNTSGGAFQPSDPGQMAQRVSALDGATADVAMTRQPSGPQKLYGEFSGYFLGADSIPKGSVLTSAKLNLRHKETGAQPGETVKITFDPGGAPLAPVTQPVTRQTLTTDSPDLLTPALVEAVHNNGLDGGKLRYELTTIPGTGNIDPAIDLATLTFTWKPPGINAQVSGTQMVTTTDGKFAVDGGIYAPQGVLDLRLRDVNYLVASAGTVAKRLTLGIEPHAGRTGPVIQTPKKSPGPADLAVYLVAYTCAAAACGSDPPSAGWVVSGTAAATFEDSGLVPNPPHRKVTVKSWRLDK